MQTLKWIKLLIWCLLLSQTECGPHSLVFLSTGRVQPGHQTLFEQLTVFDGVPISHYDDIEVLKPALKSKDLPEHYDAARDDMIESLNKIPRLVNYTVYVVQRRRGCSQSDSGSVTAFEAWAVNGRDFIRFDPETQRWTPRCPSAIRIKQQWNNNTPRNAEFGHFITERCPQLIQRIELKQVNPKTELYVFAKPIPYTDQALLMCHVLTTDKSVDTVHLTGSGASKVNWMTVMGPSPCDDESVILRLTVGISLSQGTNTYGCTVQTGGHNHTVYWGGNTLDGRHLNEHTARLWTILTGFFALSFLVLAVTCGTILFLKCVKKKNHSPPPPDPQLKEHFAKLLDSINSPDLQSVIVSATLGTNLNRDIQERWEVSIRRKDQQYYDPHYFAKI